MALVAGVTFEISVIQSKIADVSRVHEKASSFQTASAELYFILNINYSNNNEITSITIII
jgi:hypothetical protein